MTKATRQAFGEALARLGETHPEIIVFDADLSKSTKSEIFAKKFPSRFYEMGIAEANMIGTAAGISFTGKLPFVCSFGCFLTGRFDTIRLSAAYSQANIRLIGTHAGIGIGDDGYSQMGLEDFTLMRSLPTMGVFQPMDAIETDYIMDYLVKSWKGPAYLRLTRQNLPNLFPKNVTFTPGKIHLIHGQLEEKTKNKNLRVGCIATGATVTEAVDAAKALQDKGISMSVWNAHALKPFDENTIIEISKYVDLIVTSEDHTIIGGLGTCVAETLAKIRQHPPLIKFGIQDIFGESGDPAELYEKFGISAQAMAKRVQSELL